MKPKVAIPPVLGTTCPPPVTLPTAQTSPEPGWQVSFPSQVSPKVQTSPSSQGVPFSALRSWQVVSVPLQVSTASHWPVGSPQTVPPGATASAGQSSPTPLQLSATSHAPAAGRHKAVLLRSTGQTLLTPSQVSAGSHSPPEARHVETGRAVG